MKDFHLKESKTFCILPLIHLHTGPSGVAAPCCIAQSCSSDGVGSSLTQNLMELVNSEKMKQLRRDMIAGVRNPECSNCFRHDDTNVPSSRTMSNDRFKDFYEDAMSYLQEDGSMSEFKMRYFDIRFNNICNFKCRTCGSGFSSQWEQEDLKYQVPYAKIIPKNNNKEFLSDIIDQIEFMETAYFAGGEPLITEEHYILLEEMIRKGHTGIHLRYNTNLSNLKFKDKDLLSLWKYFTNDIDIYASIDHYGDRAEYIRHGTDWGVVESNFRTAKQTSYINLQMNTVLSVFNCLTIDKFYRYLIDNELYTPKDNIYTLYNMGTPTEYACHILPSSYKELGRQSIENSIQYMKDKGFTKGKLQQLEFTLPWLQLENTWDKEKERFRNEVARLDKIRGESFAKTFPELAGLLDE